MICLQILRGVWVIKVIMRAGKRPFTRKDSNGILHGIYANCRQLIRKMLHQLQLHDLFELYGAISVTGMDTCENILINISKNNLLNCFISFKDSSPYLMSEYLLLKSASRTDIRCGPDTQYQFRYARHLQII